MIANITSGKKAAPMILYNENKVKAGKAIKIDSSSDIMSYKEGAIDVLESLSDRTKTENANIQISLSLALGENVDDDTFKKIAREYLELTGFGECPFVVYRHHDTSHQHIHICTSIMTNNEEKVSMYNNYLTSQKATRELEAKYDLKLVSSFKPKKEVQSLKGLKEYKELIDSIDADKIKKSELRKIVAKASTLILQQYKPASFTETKKLYKHLGIAIKEVKSDDDQHKGFVFKLTDRPNTPVIKASDLYLAFNEKVLNRSFEKNVSKKEKSNSKRIDRTLSVLFKSYDSINTVDFIQFLKEKNIVPLYDTYKDGKAYGLSYFDEKTGFVYKASDVNKSYSFNNIKSIVNESIETKPTVAKLLEDNFYKLYNEMRSFGVRISAINFAKEENTEDNLKIALFEEGITDNLDSIVSTYLADKIDKLKKSAAYVEEKGLVVKALNEYYQQNLSDFIQKYEDVTESDYVENQFQEEEEEADYVDYIKNSVELTLIPASGIKNIVEDFIERKTEEVRILPLKDHIKTNLNDTFTELIGTLNSEEKINYINDNLEPLSESLFKLVSDTISKNDELNIYEEKMINDTLNSNIKSFLSSQLILAKNNIIQTSASQLLTGGLEQRIELYNYYLLDKPNYINQILSKVSPSCTALFQSHELAAYIDKYVDKVETVILPFLELNKVIKDKAEERDQFIAYTEVMDNNNPKPSKLYFNFIASDYEQFIELFGRDADKLKAYVLDKAEELALGKVINQEMTMLLDSLKQNFESKIDLHFTGNLTVDFYNYVLNNKSLINDMLGYNIKNINNIPLDKQEILSEMALSDNGTLAKYFDKVYTNYLPMSTANIIAKNTLNAYIGNWKSSLTRKQIAERLLDPAVIDEIKSAMEINIKSNEVSNRIYENKDIIGKLNDRINTIINNSYEFYAQEAPSNILNDAQVIVNSVGQMLQNKPSKDGLNTARNDKRKRNTPD